MKRIFLIFLSLLIFCSVAFAEPVPEKKWDTWVLIPAILTLGASIYFASNPPIHHDTYKHLFVEMADGTVVHGCGNYPNYTPAVACGFVSAFLFLVFTTPKTSTPLSKSDYLSVSIKTIKF